MTARPGPASLDPLFRPRSIAIIGASTDPKKIGGRPVAFLKRSGFRGAILPINPGQAEVQGLRAYARIEDAPDAIDQAIVAVPAAAAEAAVAGCIARGVRAIVMFSAGFGEINEQGAAAQRAIADRCRAAGVRLLGPNALGVMNPADGVFSTFSSSLEQHWPKPGRIAIASQSGAVATYCFTLLEDRGAGISHLITTGNEADVDVADAIAWLARDPATNVIFAYIEGCRDGTRLRAAFADARANGKHVVVTKVGASDVGAAATQSHTGALAGSDAGYAAAFAAEGVFRATSISEAADIAVACSVGPLPRGRRLGVVTVSGGAGAFLADAAAEEGLELPPLPEETQKAIRAILPFAAPRNPVDATAQVANDRSLLPRMMDIMLRDAPFDTVIAFLGFAAENAGAMEAMMPGLIALRDAHPATRFLFCLRASPAQRAALLEQGFAATEEPRAAVRTAAALAWIGTRVPSAAAEPVARGAKLPDGALDEATSKRVLAEAGLTFAPERHVRTADEAVTAAEAVGFPVALKVLSPDLAHKSEAGGVRLGLGDAAAVVAAWQAMMESVRTKAPGARIDGALVSPMIAGGVETVLGIHHDPVFGPVAMFGLGGVFVEVLKDVAFALAALTHEAARALILSIKGAALLQGARGRPPVDLDALADALVALSRFAVAQAEEIASVEINPFIALPHGGVGVDAVILRAASNRKEAS